MSYFTFSISSLIAGLLLKRADCVIASIPSPFTEFAGFVIARLKRSYFVIEVRDVLPDTLQMANVNLNPKLYGLLRTYFGWIYRRADLFALSESLWADALDTYGVANTPRVIVPHAFDREETNDNTRDRTRHQMSMVDNFVIVYAGSFSEHYNIPTFVEVARLLKESLPRAQIVLVGTGYDFDKVDAAIEEHNLENVVLTGGVPPDHVYRYLQAADTLLLPQLLDDVLCQTKIVEYLAAAKPVVCMTKSPSMKGAEKLGFGVSVPWGDAPRIASAITRLADNPALRQTFSENGYALVMQKRERMNVVKKFDEALRLLVGDGK